MIPSYVITILCKTQAGNGCISCLWGDNLQIVHDYRTLHAIPELDRQLSKTLTFLKAQLSILKCRIFSPAQGALCAYFDFKKPDCIAFRADMDALPIREQTNLPWQSRHPGVMHACGHDGHTAILLELARRIHKKDTLPHNVLLIFQPAEETDGGAESICQAGVLNTYKVRAIFGLHLWPGLPKGQLFSRGGTLMSRSCGVSVCFTGKSVHIASAEMGLDALSACCHFLCQAENIKQPFPFRLKFGKLSGGTAGNILCDRAELLGSLRTYSENCHQKLQSTLTALCNAISQQNGCEGEFCFSKGYPAVCNDIELWKKAKKICSAQQLCRAFWTADDFSFYQRQVPGVYFLLGVGDTPPLHSPEFSFDEAVLSTGAECFFRLCEHI